MNGWCITYSGFTNSIFVGWFVNDSIFGNFIEIIGNDHKLISTRSGYYENDERLGNLRSDCKEFKLVDISDLFIKE